MYMYLTTIFAREMTIVFNKTFHEGGEGETMFTNCSSIHKLVNKITECLVNWRNITISHLFLTKYHSERKAFRKGKRKQKKTNNKQSTRITRIVPNDLPLTRIYSAMESRQEKHLDTKKNSFSIPNWYFTMINGKQIWTHWWILVEIHR